MQSYVAFHLGLHCLTKYLFTGIQYEKDWALMHLFFNHNVVPDQLACFQFILLIHVILNLLLFVFLEKIVMLFSLKIWVCVV